MLSTFTRRLVAGCIVAVCAAAAPANAEDYDRRADDSYRGSDNGSTRDGYPVPQGPDAAPPHQSYKDDAPPPPAPRRHAGRCLDTGGIQHALHEQGWHDFDNVENSGKVTYMTARRDGGGRYDLEMDSCSGEVLEAHALVAYRDAPPPAYFYPRPSVGVYIGGGYGYGHRHWH